MYFNLVFICIFKLAQNTFESDIFMDEVEQINGELWAPGNRTLISLNLSSKNFFCFYALKLFTNI